MSSEFGQEFCFTFTSDRYDSYKGGELHGYWLDLYPELFDSDDRRIVQNQHHIGYHFYEMLTAILLYQSTGYLSLMEKYSSPSHGRKRQLVEELVPKGLRALIDGNQKGEPDLLCYHPQRGDWFMAEVKGANDKLSQGQHEWNRRFVEAGGSPVKLFLLKQVKN